MFFISSMKWCLVAHLGLIWVAWAVVGVSDIDWDSENKNSYCDLISKRRIYRQQRLEDYCLLKVREDQDQV